MEFIVCLNVIKRMDPLWRRKWSKQLIYYISRKWMDVQFRRRNETVDLNAIVEGMDVHTGLRNCSEQWI